MKGLSRLPVTEEIAGSNPVERAKRNNVIQAMAFFRGYFLRFDSGGVCEATPIATATMTRFLIIYWPSSVGTKKPVHTSLGTSTSGEQTTAM